MMELINGRKEKSGSQGLYSSYLSIMFVVSLLAVIDWSYTKKENQKMVKIYFKKAWVKYLNSKNDSKFGEPVVCCQIQKFFTLCKWKIKAENIVLTTV